MTSINSFSRLFLHTAFMTGNAPIDNTIMIRYLNICNRAMASNRERFPFKQIFDAAQRHECGKVIEVNIIGAAQPLSYAMTLDHEGLHVKPHDACEDCQCDKKWDITYDYLQKVMRAPEHYIQNPAMLDWGWVSE
ncbi:MAG: hypothetical protein CL570_08300 [Alphaproteobacteria bacterium]|nr:hypothetical protein [Alphaproteobacteria bacterium]